MSDEQSTDGKKKVHPAAIAGPSVAIIAALAAVFISTSNNDRDEAATTPGAGTDEIVSVQGATPGQPGAGVATPGANGGLTYSDPTLNFEATFPEAPADDPVLKQLRTQAQAQLDKYKPEALAGAADRKANGGMEMPWDVQINWDYTAKAGGIVSLVGTSYEFTGGAHGMTFTTTHIARAATGEELTFVRMLMQQTLSPALIIAVCEALKTEKLARIDSATIMDEPITCAGTKANIPFDEMKIGLAQSTEPDRFGGVHVYFDPYAVGAYAEGSYELIIPQEVFNTDLRKEFQPLFAGKPTPSVP